MILSVTPELVANTGARALLAAIAEPERNACEPKVDGVRGLVVYGPEGHVETRNRGGVRRDWLRRDAFEGGLRQLGERLPIVWPGTVLEGELTAGRFATTMPALYGSKAHRKSLRFVVFDVPVVAGVDPRHCPGRLAASGSSCWLVASKGSSSTTERLPTATAREPAAAG